MTFEEYEKVAPGTIIGQDTGWVAIKTDEARWSVFIEGTGRCKSEDTVRDLMQFPVAKNADAKDRTEDDTHADKICDLRL